MAIFVQQPWQATLAYLLKRTLTLAVDCHRPAIQPSSHLTCMPSTFESHQRVRHSSFVVQLNPQQMKQSAPPNPKSALPAQRPVPGRSSLDVTIPKSEFRNPQSPIPN